MIKLNFYYTTLGNVLLESKGSKRTRSYVTCRSPSFWDKRPGIINTKMWRKSVPNQLKQLNWGQTKTIKSVPNQLNPIDRYKIYWQKGKRKTNVLPNEKCQLTYCQQWASPWRWQVSRLDNMTTVREPYFTLH